MLENESAFLEAFENIADDILTISNRQETLLFALTLFFAIFLFIQIILIFRRG